MIKLLEYRYGTFILLLSLLLLLLFTSGCSQESPKPKNEIVGVWAIDKENVSPKGAKPPMETDLLRLVMRPDNTFTAYNVPARFFFEKQIHYEKICGSWMFNNMKDGCGYTYICLRWSDKNGLSGTYGLTLGYKYSNVFLYTIDYSGYNLCFLRISKNTNIDIEK